MLGDAILPMPTDLRPAHTFEVEQPPLSKRKGITVLTVDIPSSNSSGTQQRFSTQPSRWRTPEFMFYGVVFATVIPVMCWIPIRLSSSTYLLQRRDHSFIDVYVASHKNYGQYSGRLSQGWLFGRHVVSPMFCWAWRCLWPFCIMLSRVMLSLHEVYPCWILLPYRLTTCLLSFRISVMPNIVHSATTYQYCPSLS